MGSTLQGFLSHFNSGNSLYSQTIDPLNTFDVSIRFYPGKTASSKVSTADKISGLLKNVANNITGGLIDALKKDVDITKLRKEYAGGKCLGKTSEMSYIVNGHKMGKDDSGLELDLTYYVQQMNLPQITTKDIDNIQTPLGDFPTNGAYIKPSTNNFTMDVINTKAPILERIFYPWMREVTLPFWAYDECPYTTATITVDFKKHADVKYQFIGCRPQNIGSYTPSNNGSSITRQVTLIFDYMVITSGLKNKDSVKKSLKDLGKAVLGGSTKLLGM